MTGTLADAPMLTHEEAAILDYHMVRIAVEQSRHGVTECPSCGALALHPCPPARHMHTVTLYRLCYHCNFLDETDVDLR